MNMSTAQTSKQVRKENSPKSKKTDWSKAHLVRLTKDPNVSVTVNIPEPAYEMLNLLAKSQNSDLNGYVNLVLGQHIDSIMGFHLEDLFVIPKLAPAVKKMIGRKSSSPSWQESESFN